MEQPREQTMNDTCGETKISFETDSELEQEVLAAASASSLHQPKTSVELKSTLLKV